MEPKELLSKLDLIEEHARFTLDEFPKHLTRERQRMIIALVHQIRVAHDPEATVRLKAHRR